MTTPLTLLFRFAAALAALAPLAVVQATPLAGDPQPAP